MSLEEACAALGRLFSGPRERRGKCTWQHRRYESSPICLFPFQVFEVRGAVRATRVCGGYTAPRCCRPARGNKCHAASSGGSSPMALSLAPTRSAMRPIMQAGSSRRVSA